MGLKGQIKLVKRKIAPFLHTKESGHFWAEEIRREKVSAFVVGLKDQKRLFPVKRGL